MCIPTAQNTHAETITTTLPATVMIEQFAPQLTDNTEPQMRRSFKFSDNGIDWTLTFFAPDGAEFTDAEFADYGEAAQINGPSFFARKGSYADSHHIGAYTLQTDYFADKVITSVSVSAALFYSEIEKKVPVSVSIGSSPKLTAEPEAIVTARRFIQPIVFTPEAPAAGRLTISSDLEEGGQFAFLELSVTYQDSPATLAPTHRETVGIGHVVELTCPDSKAEIFYSINSDSFRAYDRDNGIVLTDEGNYTISYYAKSPGYAASQTATVSFTAKAQNGLDRALALWRPIEVKGLVVSQGNGYTLIGKHATADAAECIAIDNGSHPDLRTAQPGTAVVATGRLTDRFPVAAIGSISSLSLDGKQSGAARAEITTDRLPESATAYDLQGRPATSRSRFVITPGSKRINKL